MNAVKQDIEKLVQKELESANQKFPVFHSDYEGAAVILREIDNAKLQMVRTKERFENVWSFVKHESHSEELTLDLKHCAIELACSAIQVEAMAQKFINSQKEREKSEDN